jgi:hypothetical protein
MTTTKNKAYDSNKSHASNQDYFVRALEAKEWPVWNAFVTASPQGTLFHSTKWLEASEIPFSIFGCFRQDTLVGGLAVQIIGPKIAGQSHRTAYSGVILPPPVGKYLTTLAFHKNVCFSLASHIKMQFSSIRFRMSPEMTDLQPFISSGYSVSVTYTYRANLIDLDETWLNMEDKKRNDVRKAERDGVSIDHEASLTDVLSLQEMTFQRLGKKPSFGELEIHREKVLRSENQCRCFVAKGKSGEALAGVYMVWDEKSAYYLLGGHNSAHVQRGAASLAIWEAMRYAGNSLGLKKFDFAGGNMRLLERFFRDFGGILTPIYVVDFQLPSLSRDLHRVVQRLRRVFKRK